MQLPRQLHCYLLNLNDWLVVSVVFIFGFLALLASREIQSRYFLSKALLSADALKKKKKLKALRLIF